MSCCSDSRKRVFPIDIVVPRPSEKRETKVQYRPYGWRDSGPASLLERSDRRHDVSPEISHPAPNAIVFDLINAPSVRPLIQQIWELDPASYSDLNECGEPPRH